jgi:hypothetical protein
MLDAMELEKIEEMIPAKSHYAVIASWRYADETAETWDDLEHVHYCNDWAAACEARRAIEAEGLEGYIIEPAGPWEDDE